jgi:putative CocE/NonD family hydrolase
MDQADIILKSCYVTMRDGVRVAVSIWLPQEAESMDPRPAVLMTTRYWRAMALREDRPEYQGSFSMASHLWRCGYTLVLCDARGTGASFGTREIEMSADEVADIGEVIEWIAAQPWSDGRVATSGTSYTADTTFLSFVTSPPALKVGVARAADFDVYRELMAPGGIVNTWMAQVWGEMTGAMDRNDAESLFAGEPDEFKNNVIGVRPVDADKDGTLLAQAIAEHQTNFNARDAQHLFEFIDDTIPGRPDLSINSLSLCHYQDKIQANATPIVYRAGWYDAGTALGALSIFTSLSSPKRIIIGPWNHGGNFRADPFQPGGGTMPESIPMEQVRALVTASLDAFFKEGAAPLEMDVLEYYTLGENKWKSTHVWPLLETRMVRLYLSADRALCTDAPSDATGSDPYRVDPTAGSGQNNRWHTQMGRPVYHPDRREVNEKLLVYQTPPLETNLEITGHPVIHLFVRSTATDGHFYAYLEAVLPDGRVKCVTDGQLRAIHRKVSDDPPPYTMFGPYHTFERRDAIPLVPDEVAEIAFDLLPISVRFATGWRIRLAIAGADIDVFAPIPGCEAPEITVERNSQYASYIDLPVIEPAEQEH